MFTAIVSDLFKGEELRLIFLLGPRDASSQTISALTVSGIAPAILRILALCVVQWLWLINTSILPNGHVQMELSEFVAVYFFFLEIEYMRNF